MTDLEQMTADIQEAMRALGEAHAASEALRAQPDQERLAAFQKQMRTLSEELQEIQYIFSHEDEFFNDEVADALSKIFTGKEAPWHKA